MAGKQRFITEETVDELLGTLGEIAPGRSWEALEAVRDELEPLGLAERVGAIRDALLADLPGGFSDVAATVEDALELPGFSGWMIWPVSEAAAVAAVEGGPADFERGLELMARLTPRLTAEFALRRFLRADAPATFAAASRWAGSPDPAVRRLASEGTRPRLPWALRVPSLLSRPEDAVPILDALREDPDDSVRRSVGNHLNDVSRDHPELAAGIAARWLEDPGERTPAVVRRGLRTLVKRGDPAALGLMGFGDAQDLAVAGPELSRRSLALGDELEFSGTVRNDGEEDVRVAVDFVVHFMKASGRTVPTVFKLTTGTLAPGETLRVSRAYPLRERSTRRHYAGEHALELQVNGRRFGGVPFTLTLEGGA